MQFAIFGGKRCRDKVLNDCALCTYDASGLQVTFLLYNNDFSTKTAEAWEKMVFERNIKSFNKAMNNDYHMEIEDDDGYEYNTDLIKNL
jgi:hypothetical protein